MASARQARTWSTPARKSPLRVVTEIPPATVGAGQATDARRLAPDSVPALRQMMISEFCEWLRSRTSRHGRPFQHETVSAYRDAAVALDAWMTRSGLEADFTGCDPSVLNKFFANYLAAHCQSGTNTKQRNLRHLFTWLEETYGHPHPYTNALHRYSPVKTRPSTLAQQFIADLMDATGGGRARDFEPARDHAMIRMLTEGVRRTELVQVQTGDLSADLIARPFVRVVPLKGARDSGEGRIVALSPSTARALLAYLRARRSHRLAGSAALWLGTRNRGPMTGSGLYRMLQRRAEQAGYDPDVHPHQFRHTFANDWLEGGGAEGDLMRLMGWSDRSMLDRYGADLAVHRAIQAKQRMGEMY
jgi:site-specific recombinase XerD